MKALYYLRLWDVPWQAQAHALLEKDGAYLTQHGRLGGFPKAACFVSDRAARLCLELWTPSLRTRWGEFFKIDVESHEGQNRLLDEADSDTDAATLLARARSGRFASNQVVLELDLLAARRELERLAIGLPA